MAFEPSEAELTGRVFLALSDAAARLWLRAGFWSAATGERAIDGVLLKSWLCGKKAADELVRTGLWAIDGGSYLLPEREESLSAKRARAGRQGGLAKASKPPSKPVASDLANPGFASLANAGLVLPLASPSPISVRVSSSLSYSESSSFELSSEEPEPSPARAPKRRSRRCPDGFELNETGKKLCADLRIDWSTQEPKFRDWEYKDAKSDWQAAARTWIRNAAAGFGQAPQLRARNRPATASDDERARMRNNLLDDAKAGRAGAKAKAWAESGHNLGKLADELEAWQRKRENKQLSQQMAPLLEGVGR